MRRRGLAVAAGLVVAACVAVAATLAARGGSGAGGETSTLRATWADADGNGILERGPGEAMRERTDLAPVRRPGRSLALLAQVTDLHVRDEESPTRAQLLDRLGAPFTSTFRPHEALSTQTADAAVRAIDRLGPQATLVTGDLLDNAQANELDQALAVLGGGRVDPDSGGAGYDGFQRASGADPFLYRPDVDAPRHPGLLARAQRPFRARGLDRPWYPALGNHDLLVQGEAPPSRALDDLATGARVPDELDRDLAPPAGTDRFSPALLDGLLARVLEGRTRRVAPDRDRRLLRPAELLDRLRAASGASGSEPRLDYAFDVGPAVRVVVLDLVRRRGGSRGVVARGQEDWLRSQLARAGSRWVIVASHQPLASSAGGDRLLDLLDRWPRVVAALSGHTHDSSIEPRRTERGGYWLIGTPSLADFPQQVRALRLRETAGGGVVLETWMLDTAPGELVDTSRELAFLDVQGGRPEGSAGSPADRNARLYLPAVP